MLGENASSNNWFYGKTSQYNRFWEWSPREWRTWIDISWYIYTFFYFLTCLFTICIYIYIHKISQYIIVFHFSPSNRSAQITPCEPWHFVAATLHGVSWKKSVLRQRFKRLLPIGSMHQVNLQWPFNPPVKGHLTFQWVTYTHSKQVTKELP